ncbi:MAG: hypothetical protein E6J32_01300 [Chloroflexi bacterium]|nr:MAG: hypothetical protein E6J32_01300 [Chloroflexota bacterium]
MTPAARSVLSSLAGPLITAVAFATTPVLAADNPWSPATPMTQPHQAATATLLPNGKVLEVGSFAQPNSGAEAFDPNADSWSPTGPMLVTRALATATLLKSGKVLIVGGIAADTGHSTTRTELYDPITNAWSLGPQLAVPRSSHTATLLPSGKVLVAGGQNAGGYLASAELYDPISGSWTTVSRMDAGYTSSTATLLANGKVLIAGGATLGDGRAELYDPATNQWSSAGRQGRVAQTATRLANGRVLVTGQGAAAALYDPGSNTWSDAGTMLQDRVDPSATLLADGRVLVVGGTTTASGQQLWLSSAETYDPASNRWSPAGCMSQARWEQTATLLPTNRVLIAGGDAPSVTLSSAELFDPSRASGSEAIDSCPTNPPTQSGAAAPSAGSSAVAAPSTVSTAGVTHASAVAIGQPAPLKSIASDRSLTLLQPMEAAGLTALILAALSAAFYLWARWRKRRI